MSWLEVIALRSPDHARSEIKQLFNDLVQDLKRDPKNPRIRIYQNHTVLGDYSIHLMHRDTTPDAWGSVLGMSVASSLKAFGLVNHSIWEEHESKHIEGKISRNHE